MHITISSRMEMLQMKHICLDNISRRLRVRFLEIMIGEQMIGEPVSKQEAFHCSLTLTLSLTLTCETFYSFFHEKKISSYLNHGPRLACH